MTIHSYFPEREMAMEIVACDPDLLKTIDTKWAKDRLVVESALMVDPLAFCFAHKFHNDKKMAALAVSLNGLTRFWLEKDLRLKDTVAKLAEQHLPKEHLTKRRDREIYLMDSPDLNLKEQLTQLEGIFHSIIRVPFPKSRNVSSFIRDSNVTLFDGIHLIPYNINKETKIESILETLAFDYVDNYYSIENDCSIIFGKGFTRKETDFAMIMGLKYDTSFKRAETCIEGGNCFLFMSNEKHYALVGNFSLYLSWIALQQQGYFEESLEECLENAECAYQVQQRKKEGKNIGLEDLERANTFEAQLMLTKQIMAKELGVPLDQLIIIPQTMFHIDMELFITPNGEIVIHDDQLAIDFIENSLRKSADSLTNEEKCLHYEFLENAKMRLKEADSIIKERNEILNNSGLTIQRLPVVFESKNSKICLNYCNGIFLERSLPISNKNNSKRRMTQNSFYYITTGPSVPEEQRIHQCFVNLFNQTFPDLSFQGITGMSKFVSESSGGIHCLTSDTALV